MAPEKHEGNHRHFRWAYRALFSFDWPCARALFEEKMALPTGFEPVTHGLEGRCSIQLSYGSVAPLYTDGLDSSTFLCKGRHIDGERGAENTSRNHSQRHSAQSASSCGGAGSADMECPVSVESGER